MTLALFLLAFLLTWLGGVLLLWNIDGWRWFQPVAAYLDERRRSRHRQPLDQRLGRHRRPWTDDTEEWLLGQ